jgi:hypothetical protein
VNFDWTQISFIFGNLLGWFMKSRPNTGIFKDKYIPGAITILMLIVQGLKVAIDGPAAVSSTSLGSAVTLAGWGWFTGPILDALKQAGLAILLHQLKKQAPKPA